MKYARMTKRGGCTKDLDLTQEMGYSHIYNRLAELENKIADGRLIEFPCKVGDEIYAIPSKVNFDLNILSKHAENNRVYKQIVDEVRLNRNGWYIMTCDYHQVQVGSSLGETWFLTHEAAEKKLKELQEAKKK